MIIYYFYTLDQPHLTTGKGVALIDTTTVITALKPIIALSGSPVSEAVWHYSSLTLLLKLVITNRAGGIQRLLEVTAFKHLFLLHGMTPDTGKSIGLQLHFYRQPVDFRLRGALLHLTYLAVDTQ